MNRQHFDQGYPRRLPSDDERLRRADWATKQGVALDEQDGLDNYLDSIHPKRAEALLSHVPTAAELEQRAEWAARHGLVRALELAEHALHRKRNWSLRRQWEGSKTAARGAMVRRGTVVEELRTMLRATWPAARLSYGELARRLEAREVLTPLGSRRWSAQQVKRALRHALRRQPKAMQTAYLPDGVARAVKVPKVKAGKYWVPRKIRAKLPGAGGYAVPKKRLRSRITKRA